MPEKKKLQLLAIYSFGHFLVDFCCAFLMFTLPYSGGDRLFAIILYNFFAFAMQMPIGLIADKLNRNGAVASVGLLLTLAAFLLRFNAVVCAVVLGLGNCLYHIGGGVDVLNFNDKKQWLLGVFVSPGAIGLFVGTVLANSNVMPVSSVGILMLLLYALVILAIHLTHSLKKPSKNPDVSVKPLGRMPAFAIICLFLVVILRSYVGLTLYTPWKNGLLVSFISVLALALGKTAGGFLADKFGCVRTASVSLFACSVLFLFSENAVCGILAIFLFNMTMPLTLFAMAKLFPNAKGFAFGSLTFALFLGSLPSLLSLPIPFYGNAFIHSVEAAVSLILLVLGLATGNGLLEKRHE